MGEVLVALTFDLDLWDHVQGYPLGLSELTEGVPRLLSILEELPGAHATWFIRADSEIAARFGEPAFVFREFAPLLDSLRRAGHEVGWHPHWFRQTDGGHRAQDTDCSRIMDGLQTTYEALAGEPLAAVRMGWGFQTNQTMAVLEGLGFEIDSSAIPRRRFPGESSVKDWTGTPAHPFHPSQADYRMPGEPARKILEIPMSTEPVRLPSEATPFLRNLNIVWRPTLVQPGLGSWLAAHNHLVTITHPYEALSQCRPGRDHPLITFSEDAIRANLAFLTGWAKDTGNGLRFVTLSEMAQVAARLY